jgi:ectoine hydroxylase-related dioxygenase (phytanoyl-CoA dioxygenase family)
VFNRVAQRVEEGGFAIVSQCLSEQMVGHLCSGLGNTKHAQRNLLDIPIVRELAVSEPVKRLVAACLGKECFAVRGILFNKTQYSNWKVAWHQDRTIAVRQRKNVAAFGPWSVKAGVPSVQPPAAVMAKMLAIRLHLDESHESNGPLRVIPGSHKVGCLSMEEVASWRERPSVICAVPRGGAILMRPLLVHASSSCSKPEPRRVIHLEFAAENLPGGLEWRDRV